MKKIVKKIISVLIFVSILISILSYFTIYTNAYSIGDLNNDRKVSAADSNILQQLIVGGYSSNLANQMADVNIDTKVNSADLNLMKKFFVGTYNFNVQNVKINEINICGSDISNYVIELGYEYDECMKYAADTLQSHIYTACGLKLDIVSNADESMAFRLKKDPTMEGSLAGELGDEGYIIETSENGITFTGGRYSGCMHAVYDFLQNYFGFRYYYNPDLSGLNKEDGAERFIYENDKIIIGSGDINISHMPSIQSRNSYGTYVMRSPALAHNGERYYNNNKFGVYGLANKACHGIQNEGYFSEAEMNDMKRGYAYGMQPCYSNETMLKIVIERVLNRLDSMVSAGYIPGKTLNNIDVSQIDCGNFCLCRLCTKVYREEQSNSGAVLRFTNAVEEAIQARPEYKDKIFVGMLAYAGTSIPPAVTRPNKMVMISYCFYIEGNLFLCANHGIGDKSCPVNKVFSDNFEKWAEFTDNLFIWYYPMEAYFYGGTTMYIFNTYEDFKYMAEHHVYGIFTCGEDRIFDFSLINYTLMQRLMWNSDITYDEYVEMVKETIRLMYGNCEEEVFRYMEIFREAVKRAPGTDGNGNFCGFHSAPMKKINMTYIKENAEEILYLLNTAYSKGETPAQKKSIDTMLLHARYILACAIHTDWWLNGTEEQRIAYKENLDYYVANAEKYQIPLVSDYSGFELVYVPKDYKFDYNENPFIWMKDLADYVGTFGGWDDNYNY